MDDLTLKIVRDAPQLRIKQCEPGRIYRLGATGGLYLCVYHDSVLSAEKRMLSLSRNSSMCPYSPSEEDEFEYVGKLELFA